MSFLRKTFASFTNRDWRTSGTEPVIDEQDAVKKALASGALCFTTYDMASVTLNGQELNGAPENFSARRYVGIEKIYTKADVLAQIDVDEAAHIKAGDRAFSAGELKGIYNNLRATFNRSACDAYMSGLERQGEFTSLQAGEKAFDHKGAQIWPQP